MGTFAETAVVDHHLPLPTKENNFRFPVPFAVNKQKFAVSVFHLHQTIRSCRFPLVLFSVCSSVFTEVDLWNFVEVGIFLN
jgi:hypothetical protein